LLSKTLELHEECTVLLLIVVVYMSQVD